jgi:hypothetical protein
VYLAPDDAKSDVFLVAAVLAFGGAARGFVSSLPLYPQRGLAALLLDLAWIVALTGLVPVLLARYRGDGLAAFGLGTDRGGLGPGLVLAAPAAALGLLLAVVVQRVPAAIWLGQVGTTPQGDTVGGLDLLVRLLQVVLLSVGTLLVVSFLAVRGREGFPRSPTTSLTALLRTIGMVAAGLGLVLGLARAVGSSAPGLSAGAAAASALAGALVVVLADRLVPHGIEVPRTAVVAPVVVVLVASVLSAGGLLGGGLFAGVSSGALGVTTVVAVAALAQTRRGAWAAAPLVLAVHWWPTCLAPLPLAGGIC